MYQIKNNNGILQTPDILDYVPDPRGWGAHLFYKMKEFSTKTAQINADTSETQSYGDILRDCIRVALKLKHLGITTTDVVSLCTTTHSQTCIPYFATAFLGAKVGNLDITLSADDLLYLMSLIKPKFIFCVPECIPNLEECIKKLHINCKLVVFGDTAPDIVYLTFDSFLKPHPDEINFEPHIAKDIFDTAVYIFSSGTSGLPKAICLTHYGILSVSQLFINLYRFKTVLFYTSPYWISYLLYTTGQFMSGARRLFCTKFDERTVVKHIQNFKVDLLFLPPSYTFTVCAVPENYTYDTQYLKSMIIGGSSTSIEQLNQIKRLFPHTILCEIYGLTEITGFITCFDPRVDKELINSKIGSAGRMLPASECKIIDFETNEIIKGPNKRGELLVKTKRGMKCYLNNEEATKNAYDSDGFLRTGDVVYYDEDYCFYIVDRIKEMFKYKSWHIVPAELESILLKHPQVKEALVIGYPNEEDGDHPMAVINPIESANITENDILEYFNAQVSDRKQLRGGVKFMSNIPKTTSGKYNRRVLRSMIIDNKV